MHIQPAVLHYLPAFTLLPTSSPTLPQPLFSTALGPVGDEMRQTTEMALPYSTPADRTFPIGLGYEYEVMGLGAGTRMGGWESRKWVWDKVECPLS